MACRIPILQFEQHCSTEATIGFLATFAQFFSFLILTSSSRTCSCIQSLAHLCIPFAVLLPIDPSQNSPFLQHSMLSRSELTLQTSRCGSQSVPPNLARQASLGQIRIHKTHSLARQLANCFAASAKSNFSWANGFTPCCVNLTQNQTPSAV